MGVFSKKSHFPVKGRTVLVTGGSQGMGRSCGRLLAEKGAHVVIVARGVEKLQEAVAHISAGAADPQTQRFHYVSADLTVAAESTRVLAEVAAWNGGSPPDVVWCVAGSAHPTLFVDTSVDVLRSQMDTNYFCAAYMAHAALRLWLKPPTSKGSETTVAAAAPRHLIFTASAMALVTFAGYTPYSPCKAAVRSLADTLSNELLLYEAAGAGPARRPVRVHTVFPGTIYSPGYDNEQRVKTDLSKKIEEDDAGQSPDEVAKAALAGLERGDELVPTSLLMRLLMSGSLGGSTRGGWGVVDLLLGWLMVVAMPFVRRGANSTVRTWGREHGTSGMQKA